VCWPVLGSPLFEHRAPFPFPSFLTNFEREHLFSALLFSIQGLGSPSFSLGLVLRPFFPFFLSIFIYVMKSFWTSPFLPCCCVESLPLQYKSLHPSPLPFQAMAENESTLFISLSPPDDPGIPHGSRETLSSIRLFINCRSPFCSEQVILLPMASPTYLFPFSFRLANFPQQRFPRVFQKPFQDTLPLVKLDVLPCYNLEGSPSSSIKFPYITSTSLVFLFFTIIFSQGPLFLFLREGSQLT